MCCERASAFLRRTFEPFLGGKAMRCTSRFATSSSCSPTPTLSTLPGEVLAALAPRPGGACCFRFFTPNLLVFDPDTLAHNITAVLVQTPIPPQGASRGQCVMYLLYRESVIVPPNLTQCVTAPQSERRYTPAMIYSSTHAVPQLVTRLRSRNLERHDVW